jgi:UDP-N-acetylglucosamine--N-acetylmuramyl-(pentapeptide) pyrophosphoryl-undecaprenol N-acetylglucosamine transferase
MQCRAEDLDRARAALDGSGVSARLAPFFDDVAALYARAHLVIARAGASTVAELACAGRPSLLIPLPHAIDDHQTANARALADAGAAELHPQATLTPARLAARLAALLAEPLLLARMAQAAAALAEPHAAARLADAVLALAPTEVP